MRIKAKTILIAEDESIIRLLLQEIITNPDIEIIVAENGKVAVEKVKLNSIDLVLMDIKMPEMNGIEATTEIRKFNKNIPIIALTAFNQLRQECLDIGFSDFISKPFSEKEILQIVNKYFANY